MNVLFTGDRFRAILRTSANENTDYINAVVIAVKKLVLPNNVENNVEKP